jgi:hypothetical protein
MPGGLVRDAASFTLHSFLLKQFICVTLLATEHSDELAISLTSGNSQISERINTRANQKVIAKMRVSSKCQKKESLIQIGSGGKEGLNKSRFQWYLVIAQWCKYI